MAKSSIIHEGKLFYSVSAVAKLIGTTPEKVRQLVNREGLEWANFRVNGPIWVEADGVHEYLRCKYEESRGKQCQSRE